MNISVSESSKELGEKAAIVIADKINKAIEKQGYARIVLSTGASQFDTIEALIKQDVDWSKVTMFHLDEYVDLKESHIASFRKYLKERFVSKVNLEAAYFVNGEGNIEENIKELTIKLREKPVDVGVIGIGENGHIAFNDPPADFDTDLAYKVVDLDDKCKKQQVGEGWFETVNDVPKQAITMCVKQILSCKAIVTCVPHAVKAQAIKATLQNPVTNTVPATILKTHKDWNLFIDKNSAKDAFAI
ncbi:MAG: glucosamine-6-phosphate deaminase [Pleomorphochaeta sp.]